METLLNPDTGLILWTIVSFLVLVGLLGKFAWGPLLNAIEEREEAMKREREAAERARKDSERIQGELAAQLAGVEARTKELLANAGKKAESLRSRIKADAEAEAQALTERTKAQLEEEKRRLVSELRREVAGLSVLAAERLVQKSIDEGVRKNVMDQFLKEIGN